MNYSIHASSHCGDGLCYRKGYNTYFPALCQSPQGYGSIRNDDTACNSRIHHAFFFLKFWLSQVQFPHFPSHCHSVCSNRLRNGLKYYISGIGAFCNQRVPQIRISVIDLRPEIEAVSSADKDGNAILGRQSACKQEKQQ